jgi:hypothetical protein
MELMRAGVLCLFVTLISGRSAEAQQRSGSTDDLWSRVKSGDTVYVTDSSARETTGMFMKVADGTLTALVDGQPRDMPILDVRQVTKRGGDSVWNGFLIGAAIGGVVGAVVCDGSDIDCADHGARAGTAALTALEGGAVGALIDHFIKGRKVVYRAGPRSVVRIAPVVLPSRRGVHLSVAFN